MTNNDEVVFDEKSGISLEEQKEILSKINGIAEKNRQLLSQNASVVKPGEKIAINAKKSGAVFPLAFNIAAVVIMLAGVLFLVSLQEKKDTQVRTEGAVLNLTERALIEDIRRDTAAKIASKEQEMEAISSRLAEVDAQLARLYSGDQILNEEQLAAQEDLLVLQNSYRVDLAALYEERSQILEDSRSKEAALRAQLEERAKEFAASQMRSSSELDSAARELDRLTSEQERIFAIDAHMAGGFISINELVQNSRFDQAAQTVENLRQFNNNNSVSSSRSFQARREFYSQAINSMEAMINEVRSTGGDGMGTQQRELQARNSQLEETVAELQMNLDTLNDEISSGSSAQSRRLRELEETVSSLRAANSSLESTVAARNRTITSLESTAAERNRTVTSLESTVSERNRTITSLESEKTDLSRTVADLQSQNASQEQEIASLRNQLTTIRQILE
jgi:chromosome segregation ATPase